MSFPCSAPKGEFFCLFLSYLGDVSSLLPPESSKSYVGERHVLAAYALQSKMHSFDHSLHSLFASGQCQGYAQCVLAFNTAMSVMLACPVPDSLLEHSPGCNAALSMHACAAQMMDQASVQAPDWISDDTFDGQSLIEAAAGSVSMRGLLYSLMRPAPRRFLSLKSPALFTNNKAAALNKAELQHLCWSPNRSDFSDTSPTFCAKVQFADHGISNHRFLPSPRC